MYVCMHEFERSIIAAVPAQSYNAVTTYFAKRTNYIRLLVTSYFTPSHANRPVVPSFIVKKRSGVYTIRPSASKK
jgi:hypothetical protein